MADFSASDINEAKKRVREMQNRAKSFVGENKNTSPVPQNENGDILNQNSVSNSENASNGGNAAFPMSGLFDSFGLNNSGDSSLILALILILSREKADNMLILALLYILL